MWFLKRDEKYYVQELKSISKDCWRMNRTAIEAWGEMEKKLKKMKANEDDHPFICSLKRDAENIKGVEDIDKILKNLYSYNTEHSNA